MLTALFRACVLLTAVTAAAACGGGQADARSPSGGGAEAAGSEHWGGSEEVNERRARRALCPEGECAECGGGICPSGYFCDESLPEPACEWLPACAQTPTCSCIESALGPSCRCEERDGSVYVDCG